MNAAMDDDENREEQTAAAEDSSPAQTGEGASAPRTAKQVLYRFVRLVVLCYAGVLLAMVFLEARLIFPGAFTDNRGITAESVVDAVSSDESPGVHAFPYSCRDETTKTGLLIRRPSTNRAILYFHGNGSQATWIVDVGRRMSEELDANVLLAEFRGYGDDWGSPSEESLIEDSLAAHDALKKHLGLTNDQIILYGRSLGGGCAAAVAEQRGCAALVLERTFQRLVDVAAGKFPMLPIRFLMRNRFDSLSRLKGFQGQVLQIHGTTDSLVPIACGRELFDSLETESKEFIRVPGLGHNAPVPPDVMRRVRQFLDQVPSS